MDQNVDNFTLPNIDHLNILKEKFGFESFKKEQWSAISQLIYQKKDVFIRAASGYGKSLIYQFPPVFLEKKSVVISPLISLMETQVQKLERMGISACFISGNQKNMTISLKEYTVIYSTPENFATIRGIIKWAAEYDHIALIAIDESHCASKLSADHRTAYSYTKSIKETFPNIPIVALTSTASDETTSDICTALSLSNPLMLKTPLDRPNIEYISSAQSSCFISDVKVFLLDIPKGSGAIIYVFKRAETENYSEILSREGFESKPYHSGLVEEIRRETLRDFMSGKLNFLVATNAFGMGVDRANVRVVIHYGIPKNPETYYMESGRAGRDGKPSKSIVFWSDRDYKFHNFCFKENFKKKIVSNKEYAHNQLLLEKMKEYTVVKKCRRVTLFKFLEETIPQVICDSCCDNCLDILHKKVGLDKMYKEIDSDGILDITTDARLLLNLINSFQGKCKQEIVVDFITGTRPSEFSPYHPVEYFFASGGNKPKSWWYNVLKTVKEKKYIDKHIVTRSTENFIEVWAGITRDDYVRPTAKGMQFIRLRTKNLKIFPKSDFFRSLTKTDTEYYIVDDVLSSKPRIIAPEKVEGANGYSYAFDFSAFSKHLCKTSPRKRLASGGEISDSSLGDSLKSPGHDSSSSSFSLEKSPKLQKISETESVERPGGNEDEPSCSHWCTVAKKDETKHECKVNEEPKNCTRSNRIRNFKIKIPMLRILDGDDFGDDPEEF